MYTETTVPRWGLLPTGVSQLLTMVAVLEELRIPVSAVDVWAYMERKSYDSLSTMISRICEVFGMGFRGQMDESFRFTFSRRHLIRTPAAWRWFWDPEGYTRQLLRRQNPQWRSLEDRNLMIVFKPYEFFSLLLCAVGSPRQVFAADGPLIGNDFALIKPDWRWRGVRNYASPLPGLDTIYCPEYLAHDTERFGVPKVVPVERMKAVYTKLVALPEIRSMTDDFTVPSAKGEAALILSQPLGPELCSFEEDVAYYCSVIQTLVENGFKRIVFKPHPRDDESKTIRIAERCGGEFSSLRFLNREEAKVPIEVISHLDKTKNWLCAGACSSAILGCRDLLGMEPRCFLSRQLPDNVQMLIAVFAEQNHVPLEVLSDRSAKTSRG